MVLLMHWQAADVGIGIHGDDSLYLIARATLLGGRPWCLVSASECTLASQVIGDGAQHHL
jgi:hypothetical protein